MGITDITWEEYETFNKVETPDNLYIREHNGTYYTVFELGIASVRRIFDIKAADFNAYMSGDYSADDLLFKSFVFFPCDICNSHLFSLNW